jgi:hypothetical protein
LDEKFTRHEFFNRLAIRRTGLPTGWVIIENALPWSYVHPGIGCIGFIADDRSFLSDDIGVSSTSKI